mgnify:FL=1|tara:strand:- start:640 stop:819 length:180 start_codon:yes stop_codon:yes gene_type:complete
MAHEKNYTFKITIFGQDFKAKETFLIEDVTEREANKIARADARVIEAGDKFWAMNQERE